MKIYLAHPITDYGTERQAQAIDALKALAEDLGRPLQIENPDQPQHQVGYVAMGMAYFERVVLDCSHLAFMRFPDGSIGAGVGREINWAIKANMNIYEVFSGQVYRPVYGMPTPVLSVEDTRATIQRLRLEVTYAAA